MKGEGEGRDQREIGKLGRGVNAITGEELG